MKPSSRDPVDMDPIEELVWLLDKGGAVPLWWVVKWSPAQGDALALAWASSRNGYAMLDFLVCHCGSHGVKRSVARLHERSDWNVASVLHVTWADGTKSRFRCSTAAARFVRAKVTPTFGMIQQRSP